MVPDDLKEEIDNVRKSLAGNKGKGKGMRYRKSWGMRVPKGKGKGMRRRGMKRKGGPY